LHPAWVDVLLCSTQLELLADASSSLLMIVEIAQVSRLIPFRAASCKRA